MAQSEKTDNSKFDGVDIEGTVGTFGSAGASLTLEGAMHLNTDDNILDGTDQLQRQEPDAPVINGSVSVSGPGEINLIDADDLVEARGTLRK